MPFEFDATKSRANKEKHGIDFLAAQQLWDDADAIEIEVNTVAEQRFVVIGVIKGKFWTAIITPRGENIRIISVRRSRDKEITLYEKNKSDRL